jgi:hypothetical protein
MPIATRLTNTGTLLVNGIFDENTSITPAKFRTASTTVYAGTLDEVSLPAGAVSFNGTTQYLSTSDATGFNFGTGDFTVECWFFCITAPGAGLYSTLITTAWPTDSQGIYLGLYGTNQIGWLLGNGSWFVLRTPATTYSTNTWNHLALVCVGTTYTVYLNGTSIDSTTNATALTYSNNALYLGGRTFQYFAGYMSNARVVKGTAVYTANFTPPQAILPAVSGTSLLLNVTSSANFIKDNSTNNLTVTNNGTATWTAVGPFNQGSTTLKQRQLNDGTQEVSTQFDEFTGAPVVDTSLQLWLDSGQTASYSGSGSTWTDLSGNGKNYTLTNSPTFSSLTGGGVITFAGASSQYATTATTLFNSTTTNTYSINIWVYPTGAGQIVSVDGQSTPNTAYHYTAIEITAAGLIYLGQWTGTNTVIASSARSLNAWYNLVITYNGTTATAYINGTSVGSSAIAWSAPGASTFFALMSQDSTNMSGTTAYASGSIGAFMVYNRALSADEVTTNFNALRGRYGI